MVNQQLVEQWRRRLADWQRRLDEGRPRPWLARAYVRVLSFLLAQYGAPAVADPPADTADAAVEAKPAVSGDSSTMKRSVAVPELDGKPPKTGMQIRSVLEAVQANVPHAEQGSRMTGLRPDDAIVVASFYNTRLALDLQTILAKAEIKCRLQRLGQQMQVVIPACDRDRAKPIVADHAAVNRDSSQYRREYARAWSQMGGRIGFCIGVIVAIATAFAVLATAEESLGFVVFLGLLIICYIGFVFGGLGWVIGLLLGTIKDG